MKSNVSHVTVVLTAEPEGGFTVTVPSLPGCVTYGRDLVEAKHMAADAIAGYLASMRKHKEFVRPFADSFITTVDVPVRL
jgi:predicted RNase H-like HicB family nuclease